MHILFRLRIPGAATSRHCLLINFLSFLRAPNQRCLAAASSSTQQSSVFMNATIPLCLEAFKAALEEIKPNTCVQRALSLRDDTLFVAGRTYTLTKNVHLIAIGKAATGMVKGAEHVLGEHIVDGIASVPSGTQRPTNLKTQFYTGAKNNLPDEDALENARRIEEFLTTLKQPPEQLILFLISGGGSALLPAPIPGISLEDKLSLIQLLQSNGANIRQLNTLRTALSRLKGGGLARLGHPAKMIALIISDIVGDPLELISSGPTVIPDDAAPSKNPLAVLDELGVRQQVDPKIVDILERRQQQRRMEEEVRPDVLNVIVASNAKMLEALVDKLCAAGFAPLIVTNRLEGDATEIGQAMGKLVGRLAKEAAKEFNGQAMEQALREGKLLADDERPAIGEQLGKFRSNGSKPIVLLFGGESTVRFPVDVPKEAKGGRNQELVLAAFRTLLDEAEQPKRQFAMFSLGTDGQDGPTDAAGAFFTSADLPHKSDANLTTLRGQMEAALRTKSSYQFWSQFNGGRNLFKPGKTGMNVMDVQMIVIVP